jgi:hypothetical protein
MEKFLQSFKKNGNKSRNTLHNTKVFLTLSTYFSTFPIAEQKNRPPHDNPGPPQGVGGSFANLGTVLIFAKL